MAIGDQDDIYYRIISNLPNWFGSGHPILDAIISAYIGFNQSPPQCTTTYFHYNFQYLYAVLQVRIQTATGINLDLISQDFLGSSLPRKVDETDDSYRARIIANLIKERATRRAMISVLTELTGHVPVIIEPGRPLDHGGYNVPSALAYNTIGSYGTSAPYTCWIYVTLDPFQGMGSYSGYNSFAGSYTPTSNSSKLWYGNQALASRVITVGDVLQAVIATKVGGTRCFVVIEGITYPV